MIKPSEQLSNIIKQLDADEYNLKVEHNKELARLADQRDEMRRKYQEYKSMAYVAMGTLKKISRSLSHFNANQSNEEQLRAKIKLIRILLEDYNSKVIKKEYEVVLN